MARRVPVFIIIAVTLCVGVFAQEPEPAPSTDEISKALTVIMDCMSASIVTSYAKTQISLPCSSVSIDADSRLPQRIAYFLADPAEFVQTMAPAIGGDSGNFFTNLISIISRSVSDPMISAVYFSMAGRKYLLGDYFLSGSISFTYSENITLDEVYQLWLTRRPSDDVIMMSIDLNMNGSAMERPMSVEGNFSMKVDESGSIVVNSVDVYSINNYYYSGGVFRF